MTIVPGNRDRIPTRLSDCAAISGIASPINTITFLEAFRFYDCHGRGFHCLTVILPSGPATLVVAATLEVAPPAHALERSHSIDRETPAPFSPSVMKEAATEAASKLALLWHTLDDERTRLRCFAPYCVNLFHVQRPHLKSGLSDFGHFMTALLGQA